MKNSIAEVEEDYVFNLRWRYEIQFTIPMPLREYHVKPHMLL